MIGRNRVYRGHMTTSSRSGTVLLFVVVLILLALLAAFALLPQYVVFSPDGIDMVVPSLQEDGKAYSLEGTTAPQPYSGLVSTTVEIAPPDYSLVKYGTSSGLNYMQCMYVPFKKVTSANLDSLLKEAERNSIKGIVFQMKDESGKLAWMSNVAAASSYAANSAWDMAADVAEMKADNWYLVAELSCCVDDAMAAANPAAALRDLSGQAYADEVGTWVDPWNRDVRQYIVDLCTDLISMGFDEIILSHVEHPLSDVTYTREIAASLDRTAAVMGFATSVRQSLDKVLQESGAHLCADVSHDILGTGINNGQVFDNFLKVFDRLVIETETYSDDCKVFIEAHADSTLRYVPRMTWTFGGGSWILDSSVGAQKE